MSRRVPLKDLRCVSCGEYMGRNSAQCTHVPYCSEPCENQRPLRKDEARACMIIEQAANGMRQKDIADYHEMDPRTVQKVIAAG